MQADVGAYRALRSAQAARPAPRAATTFRDGTTASLELFQRAAARAGVARDLRGRRPTPSTTRPSTPRTGAVLRRVNMVKSDSPALGLGALPGRAVGGAAQPVDLEPAAGCRRGATTLNGANAHALLRRQRRRRRRHAGRGGHAAPAATFSFPLPRRSRARAATRRTCARGTAARSWQTNRAQNAVQAFYFANRFHDHLAAAPIGFTAAAGSFEGSDQLAAQHRRRRRRPARTPTTSTTRTCTTPPDGTSPLMQMYLFGGSSFRARQRRRRRGDRLPRVHARAVEPAGRPTPTAPARSTPPRRARWGRRGATGTRMDFLVDAVPGARHRARRGEVDVGEYTDVDGARGCARSRSTAPSARTRRVPGRAPRGLGGYTYGDFGQRSRSGARGPRRRRDLGARRCGTCARRSARPTAERLVTHGDARCSPPEPSFLDERNAILQADQALVGGADRDRAVDGLREPRDGLLRGRRRRRRRDSPAEDFATAAGRGRPDGHDHRAA